MSFKIKLFVYLLFTVVAGSSNSVLAQYKTDSLQQLPEVVIIEKTADKDLRSTTPMQTLSQYSIENLNALQLSDALKHFSGVTVKDYGGIGGLKTVSVRGLGATHTGINYNGLALSDVQTGQFDIGRVSLDNIESITLNSGQSDNIFLPAKAFSTASYLNINSVRPNFNNSSKNLNGVLSIKSGSLGLFNPALTTNIKLSNNMSASLSAELLSAHGRYPYVLHYGEVNVDSSSVEKRNNSDVNNLRLETALFVDFNKNTKGDIRLYYYQSERGLPGATIYYNTESYSKQRVWDKTFFTQAHLEHQFSSKWTMQLNAKYNRGYLRYLDPTYLGAEGKIEDIFTQNESYASISSLYRLTQNLSLSLASDLTSATMYSERETFATPTRFTSQSAMAVKWVNEHITATSSLLYTKTFEYTKIGEAAENRSKISPHISASYKPLYNHDFRIRAYYKNSFRLPTFNDLYYPIIGTRNLQPESAYQYNIGATYSFSNNDKFESTILMIDGYHNRVKNKIIAYPSSNLHLWTMMNMGEVHINGLDLSAETSINISTQLSILMGLSYTFQNALDKTDSKKSTYNHQIPYTPQNSGSVRSIFKIPYFNIAYNLLWSGDRYTNAYNSNEFKLKGYTDHSVSISKDFKTNFIAYKVSLEALNITNKNYEIVKNYPMPGRTIRININMNF